VGHPGPQLAGTRNISVTNRSSRSYICQIFLLPSTSPTWIRLEISSADIWSSHIFIEKLDTTVMDG
jgi:hypothetical protein